MVIFSAELLCRIEQYCVYNHIYSFRIANDYEINIYSLLITFSGILINGKISNHCQDDNVSPVCHIAF